MNPATVRAAATAVSTLLLALTAAPSPSPASPLEVFDEVTRLVEEGFFDPALNGLDWRAESDRVRRRIAADTDRETLAREINGLLARLDASHTAFFTSDDPRWFQLVGVFVDGWAPLREALTPYLANGAPVYSGIGVMLETHDGAHFVAGVLDGFPADRAGVRVGDRIVAVDGEPFHPIRSFAGRDGRPTRVTVERAPGDTLTLAVTPVLIDGRGMFEEAMRNSVRIIDSEGLEIGYVRAWSYAGRRYHDIVTGALTNGELRDADALILDLRGGWGGADPSYLNFFVDQRIVATSVSRDGERTDFASGWARPVVLLIDEGSRSGKELLAHGFRALDKGPIVGERTAGAVLAGRINALSDGSVLYLAVAEVLIDGQRLEGVGVAPDIEVPFEVRYAAGADPQLERAVREAVARVHQR